MVSRFLEFSLFRYSMYFNLPSLSLFLLSLVLCVTNFSNVFSNSTAENVDIVLFLSLSIVFFDGKMLQIKNLIDQIDRRFSFDDSCLLILLLSFFSFSRSFFFVLSLISILLY